MKKFVLVMVLGVIGLTTSYAQERRSDNGRRGNRVEKIEKSDDYLRRGSRGSGDRVERNRQYPRAERQGSRYSSKHNKASRRQDVDRGRRSQDKAKKYKRRDRVEDRRVDRYNGGSGTPGRGHKGYKGRKGDDRYDRRDHGTYDRGHRQDRPRKDYDRSQRRKWRKYGSNDRDYRRGRHYHYSDVRYGRKRRPYYGRSYAKLRNARSFYHNGLRYHCSGDRYYRYINNRYVVAHPFNYRVNVLPRGYVTLSVGNIPYYFHGGNYYQRLPYSRGYEIVEAPIGAIVYTLPDYAEEVYIGRDRFYECDGTLYEVVITPEGRAFKVAGALDY